MGWRDNLWVLILFVRAYIIMFIDMIQMTIFIMFLLLTTLLVRRNTSTRKADYIIPYCIDIQCEIQPVPFSDISTTKPGKPSQKVFELTILRVCNRYLKKMAADAGITKNVSFHTSRHTFAVLTLAAGGDLYTVGKLLGHTSINSTQVYADVVMKTKVEAISRISNYFSNL